MNRKLVRGWAQDSLSLKNICQLEHTRHRSLSNCVVNVLAALIAYTYQEKKPSLHFRDKELATLPAVVF